MLFSKFLLKHPELFRYHNDFLTYKHLYDTCIGFWEESCYDFFTFISKEHRVYFNSSLHTFRLLLKEQIDEKFELFIQNAVQVDRTCPESLSFISLDHFYDACDAFDKMITDIGTDQLVDSLAHSASFLLTDRDSAIKMFELKSLFTTNSEVLQ